jgi:hypothetical protein
MTTAPPSAHLGNTGIPIPPGHYPERGGGDSAVNVGWAERRVSALAGGALAIYGLTRRDRGGVALALAGLALTHRATTGHCYLYSALGRRRGEMIDHGDEGG